MNRHRDVKLDQNIGKKVKIIFFNEFVETGILAHNYKGSTPYKLITAGYDVGFYKTHIKKWSVVS